MAAFSLFADVETMKQAIQALETRSTGLEEKDAYAESYAENLTQSFKDRKIRGIQRLAEEEVTHPITGQQIIVAVYGINAAAAKSALEIERVNVATAIQANQYQTVERGRDAANKAAIEASKNRKEDFNRGYQEQSGAVTEEVNKREAEKRGGVRINQNGSSPQKTPAKSQGGVFGGDVDVDDNF